MWEWGKKIKPEIGIHFHAFQFNFLSNSNCQSSVGWLIRLSINFRNAPSNLVAQRWVAPILIQLNCLSFSLLNFITNSAHFFSVSHHSIVFAIWVFDIFFFGRCCRFIPSMVIWQLCCPYHNFNSVQKWLPYAFPRYARIVVVSSDWHLTMVLYCQLLL